jgi:hypothetical protein
MPPTQSLSSGINGTTLSLTHVERCRKDTEDFQRLDNP